MKKFKVSDVFQDISVWYIEAKNKDEAMQKAFNKKPDRNYSEHVEFKAEEVKDEDL